MMLLSQYGKHIIFSFSEILGIECNPRGALLKEMILKILLSAKSNDRQNVFSGKTVNWELKRHVSVKQRVL